MEPITKAPDHPGAEPRRPAGVESRPATPRRSGALHVLEARRIAAGFDTPAALAAASGVNRQAIANIERGDVALVRTSTARKLADALGVAHLVLVAELRDPWAEPTSPQHVVDTSTKAA